ncbi:hypothetical protein F5Y12DRAFT_789007 [Xylaria sp. FL1777]|nr:hypothetical protein F5Y12DRAFT_789007 [Xylaria sp. FL1777]
MATESQSSSGMEESASETGQLLLEEIQGAFDSACSSLLFACGGSIPISTEAAPGSPSPQNTHSVAGSDLSSTLPSSPITLRWDPENSSTPASQCNLTFPLMDGQQEILAGLLRDMQPATFGFQGKDVYDESYRKASKLDPSRFASTFNPYELGIVDVVAQLLLPNLQDDSDSRRGVRAELSKLNVYSGPSGHFRAHVDTPRSVDQFGSLVVCLPVAYTGGQLVVQHLDRHVEFDWGTSQQDMLNSPTIQWAAFYSDCTREVLEVVSGHRITLTYNLYATHGGGAITGLSNNTDMKSLFLYEQFSRLLQDDTVLSEGQCIGIYTTHAYPYTSGASGLPHALKGIDGMQILKSLGCSTELLPIVKFPEAYCYNSSELSEKRFIGRYWGFDQITGEIEDSSDEVQEMLNNWSKLDDDEVIWLNGPSSRHQEPQISYAAYGNQAEGECIYSTCAIFGWFR